MADDLPQGLIDAVGTDNGPTEEEESDPQARVQQLLKALDNMPGISNEDKENLAQGLLQGVLGGGPQPPVGNPITNPWMRFLVLFGLTALIVLALAFISYKLYNNMLQRERRKELKKLQKEQKKKK